MYEEIEDSVDKALGENNAAHQTGKGNNHLVPVVIYQDVLKGMEKLADVDITKDALVRANKPYIFACTQDSESHVSGWHAINGIGKEVKVSKALNGTRMRHKITSIFAQIYVPEDKCKAFYKH